MANIKTLGLVCTSLALLLLATAAPAGYRLDVGKDIEKGLGKMVAEEIEATYGVVDDPLLTDWVNRVGQRLAAVSGRTDVKYSFKVLNSDDVNATAAPGGYIFINRGTLRFVQSEDELAAVMGHEVGHVAGKHAMKQLNAQLLGTLAMIGFQSIHAETLRTVGGLAGGLAMLKFSRDEENDADRRGLRNAVATGYDGSAMLSFFRRLETTEKEKPSSFEVYFMTHPTTPERIRRVSKEPGTAETAENIVALGDGYAARSLYHEAAATYRRALLLEPSNSDVKRRLSDANMRVPQVVAAAPISREARASRLKQLEAFGEELEAAQKSVDDDFKKLNETQKDVENELELAARSLSSASQMISRRDMVQYRQFVRMARSFDQAARVGGNVRAAREMAESTLAELNRLRLALQHATESGDSAAARQVDGLVLISQSLIANLTDGLHATRSQAGDARSAARTLHIAADSLLNSYRMPFSFSSGQFDILDLQVSTSQDSLRDAVGKSEEAVSKVAQARLETLLRRINFLTRSVAPNDKATAGLIAHYLGVEPVAVTAMRAKLEFGEAALALAQDQLEKFVEAKKKAKKNDKNDKDEPDDKDDKAAKDKARPRLKPENTTVLFGLLTHDLERETGTDTSRESRVESRE